jgi:hypothetical protein
MEKTYFSSAQEASKAAAQPFLFQLGNVCPCGLLLSFDLWNAASYEAFGSTTTPQD